MTETTKMALVPVEPDITMLADGHEAARRTRVASVSGMTLESQTRSQAARESAAYRAMLASAPNSGRVSREQLGRAAREYWSGDVDHRLYWDSMPLEGRLHEMEYMAAALRALGLEVDGE